MKQKLHIVILDFDDIKNPLLGAGQARATLEVGRRLVEKGHKITVICSKYPGYKDREEHGIYYKHIGAGSSNIRLNNLIYIFAIPFAVRGIKADVIFECFTAPISTLLSPLWTKIPVIAIPSTFDAKRFSDKYHLPFHLVERFGCKLYKYFLPYTEDLEKKMRKMNSSIQSRIVPEGVSSDFFKIKKKAPKYILFLGRLEIYQKGIDLLLNSFAKVADKIGYPLVIAGNGPDENKVRGLIQRLNLENSVKMLGSTYGAKKNRILSESIYVAFPSRAETFSCFALEALASGLPLVAFDIPGLSWTNRNVALKAKSFDEEEYAHLLKKATETKLIKKMSKNARLLAQKYTWENMAREYESFANEVIKMEAIGKGDLSG